MGFEFRIRAKGEWPPTVVSPETFLERTAKSLKHPIAATFVDGTLEIRHAGTTGMPAVSVQIEEGGFYLLDNGSTLADSMIGELVRYLLGYYASVTVDEP